MLRYIAKRLLIFIPTLIAISLLTFIISVNAPGDPVETILNKQQGEGQNANKTVDKSAYIALRHKLGFDLPLFYFSITSSTESDTLYRIARKDVRDNLAHLSFIYGDWNRVVKYYKAVIMLNNELAGDIHDSECRAKYIEMRPLADALYTTYEEEKINALLDKLQNCLPGKCNVSEVPGFVNG